MTENFSDSNRTAAAAAAGYGINTVKITKDMQDLIRCRTVSSRDESEVDWDEFKKLQALLAERYPELHRTAPPQHIGKTGLLFHICAASTKSSAQTSETAATAAASASLALPAAVQAPDWSGAAVLMAHYDVVPVVQSEWSKPAFDAIIEGDTLWGRGTLDTKGTVCAILEAVEQKLSAGWRPRRDLYLAFSGEEETSGPSCSEIVSWFESQGIRPEFVLDEGGAIVEKAFPGVEERCAMIGTAEKGSINIEVTVKGRAGHASAPPRHSAVGLAAIAISEIENHPYHTQLTKPVREMLKILAAGKSHLYEIVFKAASREIGGEVNALMHTTCAVTRLRAGDAYNVLPATASFGMNLRLLGIDTVDYAVARIRGILNEVGRKTGGQFDIKVISSDNPSPVSRTDCCQWEDLRSVILKTWPGILVSPYLMMACSDSRHYCRISDKVYRFSGMFLSKEDRGMIHGKDERIRLPILFETVRFYLNLLEIL